MSPIYGEGRENALARLQNKIRKKALREKESEMGPPQGKSSDAVSG